MDGVEQFNPSDRATGNPPWHMWGSSQSVTVVEVPILTGLNTAAGTVQLARINYRRPESWRFLFAGTLTQADSNTPGNDTTIQVDFDLIVGVGRTAVTLGLDTIPGAVTSTDPSTTNTTRGFCRLRWRALGGTFGPVRKWTMWGISAPLDDSAIAPVPPDQSRMIDSVVASDLQCRARIAVTGVEENEYKLNVTALFAPRVHLRPDWFNPQAAAKYRGSEIGGA